MSRLLLALASLVVLLATFLGTSWLLGGGPAERRAPADAAARPAPAPVAAAPARAEPAPPARETAADAEAAWAEAARRAERRERRMRDALLALEGAGDATVDQQLDLYRRNLRDALEGTAKEPFLADRAMLTEAFLRREAVQEELAAMGPGARARQLEHVRREMGYTQEELDRMAALDAHRDARWENGLAYMRERRRVVETFEGAAREEELHHLREEYFGHEAPTLAREEESGFFRYARPRVYGRN